MILAANLIKTQKIHQNQVQIKSLQTKNHQLRRIHQVKKIHQKTKIIQVQ